MKNTSERQIPEGFCFPEVIATADKSEKMLLALSGGADSTALLDMLMQLGYNIELAHLDHMIRGEEAKRDAEFCRQLAEKYNVPIFIEHIDIPSVAGERGESLEEAARRERYAFLLRVMNERKIKILLTAHNADDNLETMLFRLARGTGARGMCGIPPLRQLDSEKKVVRPILGISKAEILSYCNVNGLSYVTDSTNFDTAYSRNRVRANILPELKAINPDAAASALRLSKSLRADCDYLDSLADEHIKNNSNADGTVLDCSHIAELPSPILTRILCRLYLKAGGAMLEEKHIAILTSALHQFGNKNSEKAYSLPGEITAVFGRKDLRFIKSKKIDQNKNEHFTDEVFLMKEGKNILSESVRVVINSPKNKKNAFSDDCANLIYNLSTKTRLNADKIRGGLFARRRLPGDKIVKNGIHKNVKKLLCDKGIPLSLRNYLPIICDDDGIVFIPFIGARDGAEAKLTDDESNLLDITVLFKSEEMF